MANMSGGEASARNGNDRDVAMSPAEDGVANGKHGGDVQALDAAMDGGAQDAGMENASTAHVSAATDTSSATAATAVVSKPEAPAVAAPAAVSAGAVANGVHDAPMQ